MTDQPDDPSRPPRAPGRPGPADPPAPEGSPPPEGYPPPLFAPAAAPPEGYPPPLYAPAAEPGPAAIPAEPAAPEPAAPAPDASAPEAAPAEEPLLPATYSENDLRAAIGSSPMPEQIHPRRARDDDDDDDARPRSRKAVLAVAAGLFVGVGIIALVVLGRVNAGRYAVRCEAKQIAAEQGRSFPPWGTSRMDGDAWRPIPIPASFQCVGLETDDPAGLGDAYRKLLVERAEALLTGKEKEAAQIDAAAGMLEQALLHARGDQDPHKDARQAIQRMLGDVGYWRASARLQQASTELTEAAKQFEAAAGQLPRFVSDANAWAAHVRRLIDELRAGPSGATPQAPPPAAPIAPDRPVAPAGVALPVEPGAGAGSAEPPPARPDAGIPSGGVLL